MMGNGQRDAGQKTKGIAGTPADGVAERGINARLVWVNKGDGVVYSTKTP